MELTVVRDRSTDQATTGSLYWATGERECFCLEDVVRERFDETTGRWLWKPEFKIPGKTAIPSGRYEVVIDFSNRFQRAMPHILDVPDFAGIRIHAGNVAADTEGCLLLGRVKVDNEVRESRIAFASFVPKLEAALSKERVFIEIVNTLLPTPDVTVTVP